MAMLYRMPEEDERHVLFLEEEAARSKASLPLSIGSHPSMPAPALDYEMKNILPELEHRLLFAFDESSQRVTFGFDSQPKPWLPARVLQKLEKMRKRPLERKEMVALIEDIAKISIDFYQIKPGKSIAVRFDGRIAESADDETSLLLKIQGIRFDQPVFVWQAGSESFTGWRT